MPLSIPYSSLPYRPAFGPRTARADFCEEDFIVTGWIGEFINTLTNLAYIYYAYQGIQARRRTPQKTLAADSLYYGLALVGICSAFFHALVKYHAQIADDTSMQIATACVLHRAMSFRQSEQYSRNVALFLISSLSIETIYHSIMDEQMVHELTFLLLILLVIRQTRSLIRERIQKDEEKRMLKWLSIFGAVCFLFGYLLWQLDFIYCSQLTAWKRALGMPWGFLLEFHGWWHGLTAVGAYVFMRMVDGLTQEQVVLRGGPFAWFESGKPLADKSQ
ncbi:hypothetical protein WHR41_01865 [Cladosporium halotolerans]|uniref:Alkaline phytoceramidase n=1 Tax=Cladosporium halotolerans TaxID=1052096 RepID=A0AB34KZV0_9PEZI